MSSVKSKFKQDLAKEKLLYPLLNSYYKGLKHYDFVRINDTKKQREGIDVILNDKRNGNTYFVDEKAQLDYLNEDLPTFAFELQYSKNGIQKNGWLYDDTKKTHFYALATSIYADEVAKLTSCKLTFVNRKKLLLYLNSLGVSKSYLINRISSNQDGKIEISALNPKKQGYLFRSRHKAEKPVNLILKIDWLISLKIAKQLR